MNPPSHLFSFLWHPSERRIKAAEVIVQRAGVALYLQLLVRMLEAHAALVYPLQVLCCSTAGGSLALSCSIRCDGDIGSGFVRRR